MAYDKEGAEFSGGQAQKIAHSKSLIQGCFAAYLGRAYKRP
jgi:ABC-type dipeptide/oligopeptide/nickel transport system ATPase subunit